MTEPLTPAEVDDIEETSVPPEEGVGQRSWVTIGEARAMIATIRDLQRQVEAENAAGEDQMRHIDELDQQVAEQAKVIEAAQNLVLAADRSPLLTGQVEALRVALSQFPSVFQHEEQRQRRPSLEDAIASSERALEEMP